VLYPLQIQNKHNIYKKNVPFWIFGQVFQPKNLYIELMMSGLTLGFWASTLLLGIDTC